MKLYKIKKSDIDKKGKGLYASKNIKAGTKIIDYIGKIVTNKQIDESDKYDNSKPIYLFTLNKRYTLDGDFSWNIAGLINHSCENNCEYEGKGLKIWVTAIKDIKKGEELTCDYGFGYDKDYRQFPCKCRSKNCCGYIVRAESRWRINKKFAMSNKKANSYPSLNKAHVPGLVVHNFFYLLNLRHLQIFLNSIYFQINILMTLPLILPGFLKRTGILF